MAVVVMLDLHLALRDQQSLMIEIRSDDDRLSAATAALRLALIQLQASGADGQPAGPASVSAPIPVPGAHLLLIDFGRLPAEQVLAVPKLAARQLREAGVRDAVVSVVRAGPIDAVTEFGMSARAYLRGPLGAPFADPPDRFDLDADPSARLDLDAGPPVGEERPTVPLLDVALDWWHAERGRTGELSGIVLGVQVPLTAETAGSVATAVLSTLPTATAMTLVAGGRPGALVAATVGSAYHDGVPAATLTTAPAHNDPADLVRRMRRLRDVLRAHASALVWAGVDAEPDSRRVLNPRWSPQPPADEATDTRRPGVELLADVLVPDAMWYQVISAGHLDRLAGLPPGATPLPGHRAELTVGEPEQWLPGHPDGAAVRARARALLSGCLVDESQARRMSTARIHRFPRPRDR